MNSTVLPGEVASLIREMATRDWPEPRISSTHFRIDETGPRNIVLTWPNGCVCQFITGLGWMEYRTPSASVRIAPFSSGSIPQDQIVDDLLSFQRHDETQT